jgi:hypothetical protein
MPCIKIAGRRQRPAGVTHSPVPAPSQPHWGRQVLVGVPVVCLLELPWADPHPDATV